MLMMIPKRPLKKLIQIPTMMILQFFNPFQLYIALESGMAKGNTLAGNGNDQNFQGYFRSGGYFDFSAKGVYTRQRE